MSLNIKNPEVYRLARDLAQASGQSMTTVVLDALRQKKRELESSQEREAKVSELMAIGARCAAHIHEPVSSAAHGDLLYDERGMPK